MKKKELEMILQQVPPLDTPVPHLEQYMTPATIAADVVFTAFQYGDIQNKTVIDLGCGTGIFSVGAFLAGAKKIIGVDVDKKSIAIARDYAKKQHYTIDFRIQDIQKLKTTCDTVLMNPPFGAQKSNQQADRRFLEKGFGIAQVIYSLHLKKTIPFLELLINALGGTITFEKEYCFPIKWMFPFHTKETAHYTVSLLRIRTPP